MKSHRFKTKLIADIDLVDEISELFGLLCDEIFVAIAGVVLVSTVVFIKDHVVDVIDWLYSL